jgi:hypothetical protein
MAAMDTNHLNAYVNLIEALLQCAKGEEWLLLQQHQELIDAELLTVMAQIAERLHAEGNAPAAKFLRYWTLQLTHLLQQNTAQTPAESRSQSYLQLIQTLLECAKGDEVAILSQHPELMDEGLVYTMKQVAAQLASQGSQEIAIYLKHLAAEIHHGWLQPNDRRGQSPISSPPSNGQIDSPSEPELATVCSLRSPSRIDPPIDPELETANNLHPDEKSTEVATPKSISSPLPNNQIEELLANLSSRFQKLEILLSKHSTPQNPLWYMPILEQVDTHGWIISSEEVEQLIGIKPHCDSGHNFFMRGCWKLIKVGRVGTHSSWRVSKEILTPLGDLTPATEKVELEPELSSPWSETN